MRRLLALAAHMCWLCVASRCAQVTQKDNSCVCCRRNHH